MSRGARRRLVLGVLLALLPWDRPAIGEAPRSPAPGTSSGERDFIERHWRGPIPPQGPAPRRFSPLEGSFAPASWGVCHPTQLADWQTGFHSQ